jgi:hypothetical protein
MIEKIGNILVGVLLFLHTYISLSVWVKLSPPASVIFTMPKILVPNIINFMVFFDALVIVGMMIFFYWSKKKLTIFPKIALIFFIAFFISGCLYLIIISRVSLGITESDYSIDSVDENVSYVYYDYTEDGKRMDANITSIEFYLPVENSKNTCFIYFSYGNYKIHDDMAMH